MQTLISNPRTYLTITNDSMDYTFSVEAENVSNAYEPTIRLQMLNALKDMIREEADRIMKMSALHVNNSRA